MTSPAQIVIFGASGDLTRRKLVPALARLTADGRAKRTFSVVGVSRSEKTDEVFRNELADAMPDAARGAFESLAPRVHYQSGDVGSPDSLAKLSERLDALPGGDATGRLFYLSLKPDLFGVAVARLAEARLLSMVEGDSEAWRRVVIEKPFGHDL
ncbi:MAG: glucose-6-phosphate dehydrogenase, partial [Deltaproteobacteria bacterium]